MNTLNLSENDFSIVFDEVKRYNEENPLFENDFVMSEEVAVLAQICEELHASNEDRMLIYETFS